LVAALVVWTLACCGGSGEDAGGVSGGAADTGSCTQLAVNRNPIDYGPGGAEVLVVLADGGEARLITGDWVATEPSLSPDGRQVVVVRADGDYESGGPGSTSLWVVDTDGGGERRLTDGPWDDQPAWSPDGRSIAFTSSGPGGRDVFVVPAAGGEGEAVLEAEPGAEYSAPAWSPDGRRLALLHRAADAEYDDVSVVTVAADGSDRHEVAAVAAARSLDWSPDGSTLLVSTYDAEDGTVNAVDVDTGDVRRLTEHATLAVWSADGEHVLWFAREDREPRWRLANGRIEGDVLRRDRFVGGVEDWYMYPYFGIDAGPCAPVG
jgi:TolB protein